MNPKKSGFKTTEFWTVIISYIFAGLVTTGHITSDQANVLTQGFADLIAAAIPLFAVLVNIYYIKKRAELKKTTIEHETPTSKTTYSLPNTAPQETLSGGTSQI